jgi:hypothetical protein
MNSDARREQEGAVRAHGAKTGAEAGETAPATAADEEFSHDSDADEGGES